MTARGAAEITAVIEAFATPFDRLFLKTLGRDKKNVLNRYEAWFPGESMAYSAAWR